MSAGVFYFRVKPRRSIYSLKGIEIMRISAKEMLEKAELFGSVGKA
jgi:hypothetical protein